LSPQPKADGLVHVLISGATGFLGSTLVQAALDRGHEVTALKRTTSDSWRIEEQLSRAGLTVVDVDTTSIESIFDARHIDAIVHTATNYARGPRTVSTSSDLIAANLTFPMALLSSAISHGTELFINTDSYFNKPGKTYDALQGYSLTKKYFLDWLQHHADAIHVVNMRLEHIFGPRDNPDKFIPTLIDRIAVQRVESFAMTSGEQARDFIFVTDVAEAFMMVLDRQAELVDPGYDYYEIGTGTAATVRDFALEIKRLAESPTRLDFGALDMRADEIPVSVSDSAFADTFGFVPAVSTEQGLRMLLEQQ
jgi:CDP-paratose synthetase